MKRIKKKQKQILPANSCDQVSDEAAALQLKTKHDAPPHAYLSCCFLLFLRFVSFTGNNSNLVTSSRNYMYLVR